MGCLICGRGSCTSSFHSIDEQTAWEESHEHCQHKIDKLNDIIDTLKERIKELETE